MKKLILFYLLPVVLLFTASSNDSDDGSDPGTEVNSWTFTEGTKTFSGSFVFGHASLNTTLQVNNTYTFGMLGAENTSGSLFNLVLSLLNLNFTVKTYQSGINSNNHLNALYDSESAASPD